jgi:hypothetical protein
VLGTFVARCPTVVDGVVVKFAVGVGHPAAEAAAGDGEPLVMVASTARPGLVDPPGAEPRAWVVASVAGVPLPSVPAPPDCFPPPVSTVELA